MKRLLFVSFALFFLLHVGFADAQFSQPPPDRAPPACRAKQTNAPNELKSDCKSLPINAPIDLVLSCHGSEGEMSCLVSARWFDGSQWWELDPSALIYDWAYIIDGRQYYESNAYDLLDFSCGVSRRGHVRVTAIGVTVMADYESCRIRR